MLGRLELLVMIKYASPLKIFYAILCSINIIFELFISTYTGIKLSFYAENNMGLSKFFIAVNVLSITASRYIAALGAYIPQVHSDIYSLCYVNMIVLVWLILYKAVSIPILKKVSK